MFLKQLFLDVFLVDDQDVVLLLTSSHILRPSSGYSLLYGVVLIYLSVWMFCTGRQLLLIFRLLTVLYIRFSVYRKFFNLFGAIQVQLVKLIYSFPTGHVHNIY